VTSGAPVAGGGEGQGVSTTDAGAPLLLHADFYPRAAIDAAVAAFSGFGGFSVEPCAPYHRVRLPARPAAEATVLAREFANYALAAAALGRPGPDGDGDRAA
jgi:hypothetical protein